MKKHYNILLLLILPTLGIAQTPWALWQSVDHALKHNIQIQQASIVSQSNLERALSEQIQAKYEFIFHVKVLNFYNGREIGL